jgi:hypothetical protein
MNVTRQPALRREHPAADLPERPMKLAPTAPAPAAEPVVASAPTVTAEPTSDRGGERLTEQHNVRIRPTTKQRLVRAVDKLRYETGDRSISIASFTDQALDEFLKERGC